MTEIPAPFRIPLWNALAARPDVELQVLFLSEHDPRRSYDVHRDDWRFGARVLAGRDRLLGRRWLVVNRGVRSALERFRPDLTVVGGWNQPAFFQAARFARRHGVPLVAWVESTARDERSGQGPLELLKRRLVEQASGFLVPGRAAAEYVRSFGIEQRRIAVAPNAPGLAPATGDREQLRNELGIEGCTFLCVSRLSPEKGVDVLVRAFAGAPAELVVAGDGPQEAHVRRLAPANVRLVGRVPRDELRRWYAAADAFALASRSETWGMALAEAAAAGLPLVASEAVGAAYDLIEPGVNGMLVPVGDEQALREAVERIAADDSFRARAGARSRELASGQTPERWAEAVEQLAREILL